MRRVSSRQRLVSWDAFDATAGESHFETSYEAPPTVDPLSDCDSSPASNRTRKRSRVERSILKKILKSQASQFEETICDDVQLLIASFLSVDDAKSFMMVSKHNSQLVQGATFLWEQWCHQQWSHLPTDSHFCDDSTTSPPNYSRLLDLASTNQPTKVDPASFVLRRTQLFRPVNNSANTIQYLGDVGTGDRCIRANAPLVRPTEQKKKRNLFKFLLHRNPRAVRPFVSPFISNDNKVNLTPRHVSYFEVAILEEGPEVPRQGPPPTGEASTDCVAVGLSTKDFRCFSRMPGWDSNSYGYHGDDGGVFHASGDMLKRFGPAFGKGDTIGCGVNYRNGGIFFTLNGKFLGYAWIGLELSGKDLYPTVGVDSNAPVECNFGDSEYNFDLCGFMKVQRDLERHSCL